MSQAVVIEPIVEHHRRHRDYLRCRISLDNRIFAVCMRHAQRKENGLPDKADAQALYKAIYARRATDYPDTQTQALVEKWCVEMDAARKVLDGQVKAEVKVLELLAAELPVAEWAQSIRGFSLHSLAQIVGEAGADLAKFPTVRRLWKRLGVGVIDGVRQQNFSGDPERNLQHGYNRERRSILAVIGQCLVRAKGPYYDVYAERKAWKRKALEADGIAVLSSVEWKRLAKEEREKAWTLLHLDTDARRYAEKRLVRDLWIRWNGLAS